MKKKKQKTKVLFPVKKVDIVRILLATIFILLVFFPLFQMFLHIDGESIKKVIHTPVFATALKNSVVATVIATTVTVFLAIVTAISIERSTIRFKGLFRILFVLPMLIPSISNGMGKNFN